MTGSDAFARTSSRDSEVQDDLHRIIYIHPADFDDPPFWSLSFAGSHPKLVLSFHAKALPLVPPPSALSLSASVRPTASRSRSSNSKDISTTTGSAQPPTKSRTKPQARQLPSNANARDHSLSQPLTLSSSRSKSVSSSRALFPGSTTTSALKRTSSSAAPPPPPPSRAGSVGARAGSIGPGMETKTEKLMRRSVSFTRGGSATAAQSVGGSMASRRASLASVGESQSQSSLIAAAAMPRKAVGSSATGGANMTRVRKTASASDAASQSRGTASTDSRTSLVGQTTPSKPKLSSTKVLVPETPHGPEPAMPESMAETPPTKQAGFRAAEGPRRLFGIGPTSGGPKARGGAGSENGPFGASGGIREEEENESLRELFADGTDSEESDDEMRL